MKYYFAGNILPHTFCHMYLVYVVTWKLSCVHVFGTDISKKSKENKL